MARQWKRQTPTPEATSVTELARRYHSCAVALAKSLGLPMTEAFLRDHRESVSSIFIAADRAGVRLSSAVELPPLGGPPADATNGHPALPQQDHPPADPSTNGAVAEDATVVAIPTTIPTAGGLPTRIPAGLQLPCAEALIVDLRPPQLSLLIGKVGLKALADKSLEPLHVALLAERARRFEQGRKHAQPNGEG